MFWVAHGGNFIPAVGGSGHMSGEELADSAGGTPRCGGCRGERWPVELRVPSHGSKRGADEHFKRDVRCGRRTGERVHRNVVCFVTGEPLDFEHSEPLVTSWLHGDVVEADVPQVEEDIFQGVVFAFGQPAGGHDQVGADHLVFNGFGERGGGVW